MSFIKEFKEFALKGNVVDLAIAVIIGGAFGAIVSSMVDDIITPLLLTPILKMADAENIASLSWGAVKYGNFIAAVIKFVLIALVLFLLIKGMNSLQKKKEAAVVAPEPELSLQEKLLTEIRDSLQK